MMTPQELGSWGEKYVVNRLRESGWVARYGGPADIQAINPDGVVLNVEIKAARKGADKKWRATLRKLGHTDHCKADYTIMVCLSKSVSFFVLPTPVIAERNHIVITSEPTSYRGRWAEFRQERIELCQDKLS